MAADASESNANPAPAAAGTTRAASDAAEPRLALATRAAQPRRGPVLPWLSPSHVAAAVRAQEPAFGACQELGNSESQQREGAITVGWLVGPDGNVAEVTLGQTTFTSDLVNECVLSVARKVTFPASASSAQVVWTVRLRGAEGGPLAEAGHYRERR